MTPSQMWGIAGRAQVLDDGRGSRHICPMAKQPDSASATADDDPQRADIRTGKPSTGKPQKQGEIGGPKGPEPTRYGDWEVNGRCSDF